MKEILVIFLVGLLMLAIGMIIGIFMEEKINKSYYLRMINVVENSLEEHNEFYKEFYKDMSTSSEKFLGKMIDFIVHNQEELASCIDEINKNYYIPVWKNVEEELPECEGLYYGKKDDTNSMWKVIFRDNDWYLSGYPEHKINVVKWTELY